jgi:hypothetical protein
MDWPMEIAKVAVARPRCRLVRSCRFIALHCFIVVALVSRSEQATANSVLCQLKGRQWLACDVLNNETVGSECMCKKQAGHAVGTAMPREAFVIERLSNAERAIFDAWDLEGRLYFIVEHEISSRLQNGHSPRNEFEKFIYEKLGVSAGFEQLEPPEPWEKAPVIRD